MGLPRTWRNPSRLGIAVEADFKLSSSHREPGHPWQVTSKLSVKHGEIEQRCELTLELSLCYRESEQHCEPEP